MGAAAPLATGLSLGAMALSATGSVLGGMGTSSADKYKAELLEQQAQYGELKATQTGAQMTRNLNITLGNIDAVRAAARTDPTSPTGAAVRDYTEQVGTENKDIQVNSILEQSQMDEANAAYLRSASSDALLSGDIGAGAAVLKGLAGSFASVPGGGVPGGSSVGGSFPGTG